MKKFILSMCALVVLIFAGYYAYYHLGIYFSSGSDDPVSTFMKTDEDTIYMKRDGVYEPFEIRGVNLGVGIPGHFATDYAIDKETYLRWFQWIQELGANTIRVYTILHDDFYNAFYEYNSAREEEGLEPLWLIHGVWVNDYVQNSHQDAYDDDFLQALLDDSKTLVDILHGERSLSLGRGLGSGSYRKDVSQWVIGYILGVEWEDVTVAYTDNKYPERNRYSGTYMYTTEEATPFEAMLAQVGDSIIEYETERYRQQRLVAFSNWPTTDPFLYPADITSQFMKCAQVDVEHIRTTEAFLSGHFASYHVYPYYPDYLHNVLDPIRLVDSSNRDMSEYYFTTEGGIPYEELMTGDDQVDYYDPDGHLNTYYAYLKLLNEYHTIPVVISEYGVSTGRGMAQRDYYTGRNQGHMTEWEQGYALIDCYEDIMDAGSAGGCVFTWQDEWFKRTWNTMASVDLDNTPYWSDYQTNEQYFGLLSFDPGEEESVCYVDGDPSEWGAEDIILETEQGTLSMKYDEKFLYFYVEAEGFRPGEDPLYLPIDTTPKTGSTYCENYDLTFERPCDFVIYIHTVEDSRIVVQERYEVMRAVFSQETEGFDPFIEPVAADTPVFTNIELVLQLFAEDQTPEDNDDVMYETYETGALRHGNANPDSENFDSLADFCYTDHGVEIRIPWQLLNFANPSEMMIHDDYYENYGVEYIHIDEMYVGMAAGNATEYRIPMESLPLEGWGKTVTYHERLKESYYILQEYWAGLDS